MDKSQAFAIATQQGHKLGKNPKGYGTKEGKKDAREKYDKPRKDYVKSPNPGKLESAKLAACRAEMEQEKVALSLSNLRVLKGAGLGAAGGAALGAAGGAATAAEGERGSAALKGALGGAALGAGAGAAGGWAVPRVQAGMKGGLTLGQSARAVGQDAAAQAKGLVRPRTPAPPPAPVKGAANPTQVASAQSRQSYQQLPESAQKVLSSSDLVAKHGVPPEMAAQLAGMSAKPGESMADSVARNVLRGTSPKATTFSPDAGTVAQVRRLPTAARQEMPTAMGKAAFVKMAIDTLHGGKADNTKRHFDPAQVALGKKVEREHTNDPEKIKEIVQDHLTEIPDYYTRLKKMEDEAEKSAMHKAAKGYLLDKLGVEPKVRPLSALAPKAEFRTKTAMIPSAGQGLKAMQKNMQSASQRLVKSQNIGVPNFKMPEPKPLNIKVGFAQSAYSGPLSDGNSTKYTSYIPPFRNPAVKTAGPPSEDKSKEKLSAMLDELCKLNNVISPQGSLTKTKKVGAPKASAPPGPSIQQISKPVGFGTPIAGATKSSSGV